MSSGAFVAIGAEPAGDVNPFPGLRPFEPDEDYLFFGRERQTDELLKKLRTTRFLSILGRSGSGKSSLVRSGLIPSLYGGAMTRAGSQWRVAILRPGEDPLGNLAAALGAPEALGSGTDEPLSRAFFETTLRASRLGLVECIRQSRIRAADNVLILVDQFEELFRYTRSRRVAGRDDAAAFVKLLLAARESDVPCYIAITMRSDFIGDCMEFGTLPEVINDGIYLVPRMTREELRSAVTGPVAVGGATIAPRLVSRLLNDVGDDPDQLPILQHALMRTWERWTSGHRPGEPLDLRHYEDIGTMREALSLHAEESFAELDAREHVIAEKLFKALTEKGSDARGVRRPAPVSEICAVAGASLSEVTHVVNRFRGAGRSFLMPPAEVELQESSILDISHESLMRVWQRLSAWASDEARAGQLYLGVAEAAERHEQGTAALWRDPELQFALTWREKEKPTAEWAERYDPSFARAMAFLDASKTDRDLEVQERNVRRRRALRQARIIIAILSIASLAMLALGVYALREKSAAQRAERQADKERDQVIIAQGLAEAEKRGAQAARATADSERAKAEQQRVYAEKQTEIAQEQTGIAETERSRAESERQKALLNEQEARAKTREAQVARDEAEREKNNAVEARTKTEASEKQTRRLSRLAAARALALISRDAPTSRIPLVLEAYRMTEENDGDLDDPDLFAAMHSAGEAGCNCTARALPQKNGALSVAVSPDDRVIFAGDETGRIVRHDLHGDEWLPPKEVGRVAGPVRTLALGDNLLAAGTDAGKVAIWDLRNAAATPREIAVGTAPVTSVAFQPSGSLLVAGSLDGSVTLLNAAEASAPVTLRAADGRRRVRAVAFSPDGKSVAAGQPDVAFLWAVAQPKTAPRMLCGGDVRSLAFTRDGSMLLCGTADGTIRGASLGNGGEIRLNGHTSSVNSLSFSPHGDTLASGSSDGTVRLWHIDRPDALPRVFPHQEGWVWAVAFNGDGSRVISGGVEPSIRISDARADVLAANLCRADVEALTEQTWNRYLTNEPYRAGLPCPGASGRASR